MTGFDELSMAFLRSKPGLKWASVEGDVIAAWIADMDFPVPEPVAAALRRQVAAGDLGYPDLRRGSPLEEVFRRRMRDRHRWEAREGRVKEFTDILNALQAVIHVTCRPGDAIAFHAPTYPPFLQTFRQADLATRPIPLRRSETGWGFDYEEAMAAIDGSRLVLIVNPHNPTGRSLDTEDLGMLAEAAIQSGAVIVSDEVHSDLTYPGTTHVATASLSEEIAAATVTLNSATKSFNLAGIRCAVAHVGSDRVWKEWTGLPDHLFGVVSNPGRAATLAAWQHGDRWLEDVVRLLDHNRSRISEALAARMPEVGHTAPDATYLAWLDLSGCGLGDNPAVPIRELGRLELSPGPEFGPEGRGHARLNFATSGTILDAILIRLETALRRRAG